MHFSQFEIKSNREQNPYMLHKYLWDSFYDSPEQKRTFLFRVDWEKRTLPILVQSRYEPREPSNKDCSLRASKKIELNLQEGQALRFSLCANPTKRLSHDRNRIPLSGDTAQIAWLERKLESAANLIEAQVVQTRTLDFKKGELLGRCVTVSFEGILRVGDPVKLLSLIETGIGASKFLGCGLLTLARI